jgi:hypothetical protein
MKRFAFVFLILISTNSFSQSIIAEKCSTFDFFNEKTQKVDITEYRKISILNNKDANLFDVLISVKQNGEWQPVDYAKNCPWKKNSFCDYKSSARFSVKFKNERNPYSLDVIKSIDLFIDEVEEEGLDRLFVFNEECF